MDKLNYIVQQTEDIGLCDFEKCLENN
jgi:hypothetical protein